MERLSRRSFLAWTAVAAAHQMLSQVPLLGTQPAVGTAQPRLRQVHLKTPSPGGLLEFYSEVLELPTQLGSEGLVVQIGATQLSFSQGSDPAIYHFAFNIPENKLESAMSWMRGRANLLVPSWQEGPVVHFESWNADSVYFLDPAGNILEFIAHHPLKNGRSGAFTRDDMLYTSEIGLVVEDFEVALQSLSKAGLTPYMPPSRTFAAVGDPNGLFIVVSKDRVWLPTDAVRSAIYPTEVEFVAQAALEIPFPGHPYRVVGSPD